MFEADARDKNSAKAKLGKPAVGAFYSSATWARNQHSTPKLRNLKSAVFPSQSLLILYQRRSCLAPSGLSKYLYALV